jgi:hypothetical protein
MRIGSFQRVMIAVAMAFSIGLASNASADRRVNNLDLATDGRRRRHRPRVRN